jgi:ABC-2 type transport system permease protein
MRQFKTVFKFEYLNHMRSKAYVVITVVLLVLIAAGGSFPAISRLFGGGGGEDELKIEGAAAVYDPAGIYGGDALSAFLPEYEWTAIQTIDGVESRIESGEFKMALAIDGLRYTVYEKQDSIAVVAAGAEKIDAMVRAVYQADTLRRLGLTPEELTAISETVLRAEPVGEHIAVGKDFMQNYALAYVTVFLLYMSTVLYGQIILSSVVVEKSSKAMELLVTSAKPMSLMFGKVIGTGCAGLTQFGALMLCAAASMGLNLRGWESLSPVVAGVINSAFSAGILIYAVVFFLLGFFSFAFIYAALGSTVSRMEDAAGVATLPMLLIVATFLLAMSGMMTPSAAYVRICSFVPFISPMVMFVRVCMTSVPAYEIAAALALNCAYVFGSGFVGAKIYRVGVMLYGNAPKLKDIVRYARQA